MVIFHSYVKLPEGIECAPNQMLPAWLLVARCFKCVEILEDEWKIVEELQRYAGNGWLYIYIYIFVVVMHNTV